MIKKYIKKWFHLYEIKDLIVGAHCGCCGAWMPYEIVEKKWAWSLCEKCAQAPLDKVGDANYLEIEV